MSEHVVPRDLRWWGWFLFSYVLGVLVWVVQVLRGWRHERALRVLAEMSVHHANMMRTGGMPTHRRDSEREEA